MALDVRYYILYMNLHYYLLFWKQHSIHNPRLFIQVFILRQFLVQTFRQLLVNELILAKPLFAHSVNVITPWTKNTISVVCKAFTYFRFISIERRSCTSQLFLSMRKGTVITMRTWTIKRIVFTQFGLLFWSDFVKKFLPFFLRGVVLVVVYDLRWLGRRRCFIWKKRHFRFGNCFGCSTKNKRNW